MPKPKAKAGRVTKLRSYARKAKGKSRSNGIRKVRHDFFSSHTFEELAKAQGVSPLRNPEELAGLWPADDDVDEFVETTYRDRN